MTSTALFLLISAAFFHASWNYIAKRAVGGVVFVWLFSLFMVILLTPVIVLQIRDPNFDVSLARAGIMLGDAILHIGYYIMLTRGYHSGDLSLVYPLARGTGPFLSIIVAIIFLGERPSLLALAGALLIILGICLLLWDPRKTVKKRKSPAVAYALLTGISIAGYTLLDKYAVSTALIPPVLLFWGGALGRVILLGPFAAMRRAEVIKQLKTQLSRILGVAILCPIAYVIVLSVLVYTPVSYVAPAREMSILIGTAMGTGFLAEGNARTRLTAAGFIVFGVAALAIG